MSPAVQRQKVDRGIKRGEITRAAFGRGLRSALMIAATDPSHWPNWARVPISLDAVAHHEAGHAVMSIFGGCRCESVTILPDSQSTGRAVTIETSTFLIGRPEDPVWEQLDGPTLEAQLGHLLGGPVAHALFTGAPHWFGASNDLASAVELLTGSRDRPGKKAVDLLAQEWARISRVLRSPTQWKAVRALAIALLQDGTLTGSRAEAIIRRATGRKRPSTIVSGRTKNTGASSHSRKRGNRTG